MTFLSLISDIEVRGVRTEPPRHSSPLRLHGRMRISIQVKTKAAV